MSGRVRLGVYPCPLSVCAWVCVHVCVCLCLWIYTCMHLCVSECVSVVYTSVWVCVASLSILPLCESILSAMLAVFVYVLGHFAAWGYVGGCVYTHVHFVQWNFTGAFSCWGDMPLPFLMSKWHLAKWEAESVLSSWFMSSAALSVLHAETCWLPVFSDISQVRLWFYNILVDFELSSLICVLGIQNRAWPGVGIATTWQ